MAYRLRYLGREFDLGEGQFLVGRSDECHLTLSDPLVSRVHARLEVRAGALVIEDLGSRNGIVVNGQTIAGTYKLQHGDRIQINTEEMTVLNAGNSQAKTIQRLPVETGEAVAVLSSVADKALALGRADEAERLLENYLGGILLAAESGHKPEPETAARAATYAIQLASLTNKARWVDFIFRLHTSLARPCSAEVVDKLYAIIRNIRNVDRDRLRTYLAVLDQQQANLSKAERFVYKRLQGLEALASLR